MFLNFRIAQSAFASNVSPHLGVCVCVCVHLREFVLAISLISFGSNQTFFLPHRITEAASLFWSLRELQKYKKKPLLVKSRVYEWAERPLMCVEVMFLLCAINLFFKLPIEMRPLDESQWKFIDSSDWNKKQMGRRSKADSMTNRCNLLILWNRCDLIPHGVAPCTFTMNSNENWNFSQKFRTKLIAFYSLQWSARCCNFSKMIFNAKTLFNLFKIEYFCTVPHFSCRLFDVAKEKKSNGSHRM